MHIHNFSFTRDNRFLFHLYFIKFKIITILLNNILLKFVTQFRGDIILLKFIEQYFHQELFFLYRYLLKISYNSTIGVRFVGLH